MGFLFDETKVQFDKPLNKKNLKVFKTKTQDPQTSSYQLTVLNRFQNFSKFRTVIVQTKSYVKNKSI